MIETQAVVIGGGPAGLAAAALLAGSGIAVTAVIGKRGMADDPRTVALMQPALRVLAEADVWPEPLQDRAAPLKGLIIVDDTRGALRSPSLAFDAREVGEDAFGWNVPLAPLVAALLDRATKIGASIVESDAERVTAGKDRVAIVAENLELRAPILVAADGRDSMARTASGIVARRWSYDQCAIATSFAHSAPHRGVSREYHRPGGPFTTVPLPGNRSSLVWMERPKRANELMELPDDLLAAEIQAASHGDLGLVTMIGPRRLFPMEGLTAAQFARNRTILVGEAAHAIPPIGAQGLNMSLADAAEAARSIAHAVGDGEDAGSAKVLARYESRRRGDVVTRQAVVDAMNRSLLAAFLPAEAARMAAMTALQHASFLRHSVMRRAMG